MCNLKLEEKREMIYDEMLEGNISVSNLKCDKSSIWFPAVKKTNQKYVGTSVRLGP